MTNQRKNKMKYYMVSFDGRKSYLYKTDILQLEIGETVLVPVKNNGRKIGLVMSTLKPNQLSIPDDKIKEILDLHKKPLKENVIERYILGMIDAFKEGTLTRRAFADIAQGFLSSNQFLLSEGSLISQVVKHDIPDICRRYVTELGCEADLEFGFRKAIKDLEHRLHYGKMPEEVESRLHIQLLHDPIEDDERYQRVELDVERLVRAEIGEGGYMGFCHLYWTTKKRILRDEFGIEWKTPAEMNPNVMFD